LFDPGWDISEDLLQRAGSDETIPHMANYGLGSPFPEDTLICSALGAFWPGAAPDITRFFEPLGYATTTPLLDAEVKGWAGAERPKIEGKTIAYQAFAYADYVRAVYKRKLAYDRFAKVSLPEFILRTEIMARFYQWVGRRDRKDTTKLDNRTEYVIKSFRRASESEIEALKGWMIPPEHTFRIEFFKRPDNKRPKNGITGKKPAMEAVQPATDPRTAQIDLGTLRVVYLGPLRGRIHDPREVSSRT
jgi:hypothetical protein